MTDTFVGRTAARRRLELLDAAAALVAEGGWAGLRMRAIADRVGVSRQTVYNEFGNRESVVSALALHVADHLVTHAETAIRQAATITEAWPSALLSALEAASTHPLTTRARAERDDGGFIHEFIGERPAIELAQARLTPLFLDRWPDLDPGRLAIAVETAIRLTVSHFLLPLHPTTETADHVGELLIGITKGAR